MFDDDISRVAFVCLFLVFLTCVFVLSGCSADNPYVDAWNEGVANAESKLAEDAYFQEHNVSKYFEKVGQDSKFAFILYRDLRTDVMYVSYSVSGYCAAGTSLSVMYAADGSPLLYSEWLALEADQEGGAAE